MAVLNQIITAVACSFGSLMMGLLNVWPSYTLSLYTSQNTSLLYEPMTEMEGSLLGSLPSLGAMMGTSFVGLLVDSLGRRNAGVALSIPFVFSWAMIEVTRCSTAILLARFLGGFSGGAFLVYAPIFISEIAQDSIRGTLASGPSIFYSAGAFISYVMGWFCPHHSITWLNMLLSVINVSMFGFVIESPVYLLRQNREEEAKQSIAKYRGLSAASKTVAQEMYRLKQQLTPAVDILPADDGSHDSETKRTPNDDSSAKQKKFSSFRMLFLSPSSRRAFLVVGLVISMQVFMGIVPVQVYAKELFSTASPNMSSHLCSVLFALVLVGGSILSAMITDKAGRRVLLISSSVMVCLSMTALGWLMTSSMPGWITAVTLLCYCFFFNFGAGIVPYVLLAECFVPEVQNLASILLVEWVWFLNFFIIAIFPYTTKAIGIHGMFYVFACMALFNAIISHVTVPETKGLSTNQIQEAFLRGRTKQER